MQYEKGIRPVPVNGPGRYTERIGMASGIKKKAVLLMGPVLAAAISVNVSAVPDRTTTYMVESLKAPQNRYYDIKTNVTSELSALFRRTIYDQVEFGLITAPAHWMDTDRFADVVTDASGTLRKDYDGYEIAVYTGDPILDYVTIGSSDETMEETIRYYAGGDPDSLKLTEVVPIYVSGFEEQQEKAPLPEGTEEPVLFSFVNEYPEDLKYVGVLGSQKEEFSQQADIENVKELHDWTSVRMEPVDGGLVAYMTPEALSMANDKDSVLAVLCEEPQAGAGQAAVQTEEYVDVEVERVIGSKTVKEMTRVKVEGYAEKGTNGAAVSGDTVQMEFHVQQLGERSMNVLKDVTNYVVNEKKSAVDYFGSGVREKVTQLLPEVNPDSLQIEDAVDGWVSDFDFRHGDLLVDLTFPEQFQSDDKIVAVVGTFDSGNRIHAWTALQARPINNTARVTITQNILTRMDQGNTNLLFLLKQKKE